MAMAPPSSLAFHCSQRSGARQLCFSLLGVPVSLSVPVPVPGRGHVLAVPQPGSSARGASRGRGTGRGVKWKERAELVASAAGPGEEQHRRRGATTKAASRMGGTSSAPLPPEVVTFSANISTDLPLQDSPEASFDEYLDDRPRIFGAMFPDRRRSRRLNDEEWRVQMLPLQFLFASVNPVVVMRLRCKSQGREYPPGVPPHVARVLELRATRWELHGLEGALVPSHFVLDVQGLLYHDRGEGGARSSRLKGRLQMSITLVLPPVLALVPERVLRGVAESVLRRLVQRMKQEVDGSLLADFQSFKRERLQKRLMRSSVAQQHSVQVDHTPREVDSQRAP